jgi:hypothetical protein
MMKSLRFIAALALLGPFGITGVPGAMAGISIVVVRNTTSYTMSEFYLSPSTAAGWDTTNNLLLALPILPGQTGLIDISALVSGLDGNACKYDLMGVLYGAAQFAYKYQVDVCDGATWTITP